MKKCLFQTVITMNNNGKTMLVLATILTLAAGVILSTTTIPLQQVSAQNMTGQQAPTPGAAEASPCPVGQVQDEVGNCVPDICPPGSFWQAEPPPGACVAQLGPMDEAAEPAQVPDWCPPPKNFFINGRCYPCDPTVPSPVVCQPYEVERVPPTPGDVVSAPNNVTEPLGDVEREMCPGQKFVPLPTPHCEPLPDLSPERELPPADQADEEPPADQADEPPADQADEPSGEGEGSESNNN